MFNTNIDILEMSHEESISYFKRLENLEKIRCTKAPRPAVLPGNIKRKEFPRRKEFLIPAV
jgi:hypothetical protein